MDSKITTAEAVSMSDRLHLYLDARPLGPYVARVEINTQESGRALDGPVLTGDLTLDELYTMRQHIDNAIQALEHRHMVDAICGDCEECQNDRMVYPIKNGHPRAEHCPVCHPKIAAAEALKRSGL